MNPPRVCISLTALFALIVNAFNQDTEKKILLIGNIYDTDSLDHLSYVSISVNGNRKSASDANGHFDINILTADTIDFSCTGFELTRILMGDDSITDDTIFIEVLMRPKIYEIHPADILPYKNYEEFRSALVNHENDPDADIANRNLNTILDQNKQNIGPSMDAYSNYKNLMKMKDGNNNAFLFLSSEPGKGLYFLIVCLFRP